jgi:hypothetical protein
LVAQLVSLWTALLQEEEGRQAACHYPIYGLRFLGGESLLYETSICWLCNNYYAKSDGGYNWMGFPGDLPKGQPSPSATQLRRFLESQIPIPETLARKVQDPSAHSRAGRGGPSQARRGYGGHGRGRY